MNQSSHTSVSSGFRITLETIVFALGQKATWKNAESAE
jgi:hypothetical protein